MQKPVAARMPRPTPLQRRRRRVFYALLLFVWAVIAWEWWAWAHPAPVPRPYPPRLAVAEQGRAVQQKEPFYIPYSCFSDFNRSWNHLNP